jgi:hypothetical protein
MEIQINVRYKRSGDPLLTDENKSKSRSEIRYSTEAVDSLEPF